MEVGVNILSITFFLVQIDKDIDLGSVTKRFSNSFTAVGLIETVKKEGKKSIVLDAATSALGRMINKLAKS
jgi:hypothetical protein